MMTRCQRIWLVTEAKIIHIGVDNYRPTPELLHTEILKEIAVRHSLLNIAQIACVPLTCLFGARWPTMVAGRTLVKVIAGQLAAFSTKIARLVNMETVFRRQLRKGRTDPDTTAL